jgi:hypothetical protein
MLHDLATLQPLSFKIMGGWDKKTLVGVVGTFFYNEPLKCIVFFVKSLSMRVTNPLQWFFRKLQ